MFFIQYQKIHDIFSINIYIEVVHRGVTGPAQQQAPLSPYVSLNHSPDSPPLFGCGAP